MNELREMQKAEAVKRMKKLCIMDRPIKEFEEEGKLNLSESRGLLYWLNDEEKKMVDDFEKEHNGLVYHVVKTPFEFGLTYSLLYVSQYVDEWEMEAEDIEDRRVLAYVVNADDPDCSEFGYIGVVPSIGGVARIW